MKQHHHKKYSSNVTFKDESLKGVFLIVENDGVLSLVQLCQPGLAIVTENKDVIETVDFPTSRVDSVETLNSSFSLSVTNARSVTIMDLPDGTIEVKSLLK